MKSKYCNYYHQEAGGNTPNECHCCSMVNGCVSMQLFANMFAIYRVSMFCLQLVGLVYEEGCNTNGKYTCQSCRLHLLFLQRYLLWYPKQTVAVCHKARRPPSLKCSSVVPGQTHTHQAERSAATWLPRWHPLPSSMSLWSSFKMAPL